MLMWLWRSKEWIANARIQKYYGEQQHWECSVEEAVIGVTIAIVGLESIVTTQSVWIVRDH